MFGLPFLSLVVAASYGLEGLTRTRYDLHGQKVQTLEKEEELGMKENRKRIDIREEYYVGGRAAPSANADDCKASERSAVFVE